MGEGLDLAESLAREVGTPFDRRSAEHDQLIAQLGAVSENVRREIRESQQSVEETIVKKLDTSNKLLGLIANLLMVCIALLGAVAYILFF